MQRSAVQCRLVAFSGRRRPVITRRIKFELAYVVLFSRIIFYSLDF
jgi:hypothetical protein